MPNDRFPPRIVSRTCSIFLLLATICFGLAASVQSAEDADAKQIIEKTGITGGLVIHVNTGDGKLTAALRVNERYQVHGVDTDAGEVAEARKYIRGLGVYGDVAVDHFNGKSLPYIDNLANLVVSDDLGNVSKAEVMRILAPKGVAWIKQGGKWSKTVKPWPDNIDEWGHLLHGADGNAVANDTAVGPPKHLKWVGSPRWSRHHDRMASMSALVSAGGRLFFIMDEGSRVSIQLPPKWTLVARDAFNGAVLWKRKIPTWHSHLWPLKSGPTQLARRLVAVDEVVYATLGIDAPLTKLNAATGETIHTYEGTKATEEIIASGDQVFALVNENEWELEGFNPVFNTGDQTRIRNEFKWNEKSRHLAGLNAKTGKLLWKVPTKVAPLTLTVDDERVYFHDDEKVVCLDRNTGKRLWAGKPVSRERTMNFNFGPKLVAYKGVVLYAGGERKMVAMDAKSGKELWTSAHERGGYQSPEDLLVLKDLIWSAPLTSGKDSGVFTGRNYRTGEVEKSFPPNVETYWFHHRCYIAKATENFLLPSRTGIEFVDPAKEHWDIHHWVRGGCLYGIMPCNGLVYAPPHNCACYPEAKLYGFNALAPATDSRTAILNKLAKSKRRQPLIKGAAFGKLLTQNNSQPSASSKDWPTFRGDASRSGATKHDIATDLKPSWKTKLGGKLTSVVVADGRLFVAQINQHRVVALDGKTGKELWSFMTGGRVDSPPTAHKGAILFGSADGWVYCLRATDGELAWKFQAALTDLRLPSFEQLESVWPVHGSVLVQDDFAYFVAGRSNFLDGGMRLYKVNAATGELMKTTVLDDKDPETGKDLQDKIATLQMPVGLPDILSSDGSYVYMRSQKMDLDGTRMEIGPISGNAAEQGAAQEGDGRHLFAPMGFLDDTWFHRSYWVYGKNFAGGHNGYYQAGKNTQSGRILVFDEDKVFGFGRKPQYLKWTTTLEHQLYASTKEAPVKPKAAPVNRRGQKAGGPSMIRFDKPKSLNPQGKAVTVEAWIKPNKPNGVIIARGGPADGFALILAKGRPQFIVRSANNSSQVSSDAQVGKDWTHVAGVLTSGKNLQLFVNGRMVATSHSSGLISTDPKQGLEIGADEGSAVGDYQSPHGFNGLIDEPRIYHDQLTPDEIAKNFAEPGRTVEGKSLVLACSFDKGGALDTSGKKHHGKIDGAQNVAGKVGNAMKFVATVSVRRKGNANQQGGSIVKHLWNQDVPLLARAMVKAGGTIFVAGPADVIDEEASFKKLTEKDKEIQKMLVEQDEILQGRDGSLLIAYSAKDGKEVGKFKLGSLPVWDGMAVANDRLYLSTTEGEVICMSGK
jgi:outer membrane protein assembly factor BamB